MLAQVILIIDSRKERSLKYKKVLEQDCYIYPLVSHSIEDAFEVIEQYEPDMIVVSDSFEENVNDLCLKIRGKTISYRPVLIALSKSSYLDDKLKAFRAGADDFLSEPIDPSEFSARIFAHFRRHIEELSDPVTGLPAANLSCKVLKRIISSDRKWSLMYIDIDNFKQYGEIYGRLAADRMLKTYTAILKSAMDKGDFLGQLGNDSFVILTSAKKTDQLALFLSYAFDSVSSKFYTEEDAKRGYLILDGDEKAGRRIPLVTTSIGAVSNEYRKFNNHFEAINAVLNVHKLAKSQPGSSWVIDRPKISSDDSVKQVEQVIKKILIVESDAALAYLLNTTLEMQGYQVESMSDLDNVISTIEKLQPDLLLLDAGEKDHEKNFEICKEIKSKFELSYMKVIVSSIIHDKELILNTGADLYLPKPYELITLFGWIKRFLNYD